MTTKIKLTGWLIILSATVSFAHEGHHNKKKNTAKIKQEQKDTTVVQSQQKEFYTCPMHPEVKSDTTGSCPKCGMTLVTQNGEDQDKEEHTHVHTAQNTTASWDDFPTLHPLITHFPVILLLIAALIQIAGLFIFKKEFSWLVLFFTVFGFIGAYISTNNFHPHTTDDLPDLADKILKLHEQYANWTIWLSGIASLLKIASHFLFKRKLWIEIFVSIILIASAYCVSMAGHHGAQLVHIEGIGPQGKFLESDEHE